MWGEVVGGDTVQEIDERKVIDLSFFSSHRFTKLFIIWYLIFPSWICCHLASTCQFKWNKQIFGEYLDKYWRMMELCKSERIACILNYLVLKGICTMNMIWSENKRILPLVLFLKIFYHKQRGLENVNFLYAHFSLSFGLHILLFWLKLPPPNTAAGRLHLGKSKKKQRII